jgi:hypothetical protein
MSTPVIELGSPFRITATGAVGATTGGGQLIGFYVSSTSSGTLVLRDGGSGGTQVSGTITPAVGFHRFPVSIGTGLHATVGGTIDVTFVYIPNGA